MGDIDVRIVGFVLILVASYGVFTYLYSSHQVSNNPPPLPGQDYTTPGSSSFFSTLKNMIALNFENPELFFVNSILFGTLAFLVVFIFLRYLRGV